ncbi:MAG TPA: sugar phosphate nucleotidyltransferase [Steroidobacteraceae bacterium]|nr:sugar phosphate nucleotidyltransferase [Steroidobacteraceae bacterium]
MQQNTWALVLAAGEGSRLRSLTTDATGTAVPKQFCSLDGGPSLLQEALHRAQAVAPRERICTVVAEQHRRWWQGALWSLPAANVIVQPRNRGTALGVLLPVLKILARDPLARIVFLPADHYVRDEHVLALALGVAVADLERHPDELLLLGIAPEEADPELGYILPGLPEAGGALSVQRFVEKPAVAAARELIGAGGLWNSFIFAANGFAVLSMLRERMPEVVDRMETALARDGDLRGVNTLAELYAELPEVDFSRHIMQGAERRLRVAPVPRCGWSDLGTPRRVAETIRRLRAEQPEPVRSAWAPATGFLNLAAAHARLQMAG